jgi:hemolysin activation/secretion protein
MSSVNASANQAKTNLTAQFGVLLVLILTLILPASYGQTIQSPGSEEQRRRAQADAEDRLQRIVEPRASLPEETQNQPDSLTLDLPTETPCFTLDRLMLTTSPRLPLRTQRVGASTRPLDSFFFAAEYLQHYRGHCVGPAGLNLIIKRLSGIILQKGYSTTRVGIEEQDLSTGRLILVLVPGIIRTIQFNNPDLYGTWRNAFPTGPGQLLNLHDLEQGIEQMKRVPSQDVDMQLIPADTPGESDVLLTVQRNKPWKISTNLDNSGAQSTGKLQGSVNLSLDNVFGLSDMFNIGINSDAEHDGIERGTAGHSAYYALPFGYWYYSMAASDYDYHQEVAGIDQSYLSSGKSKNLDLKFNYLFQRDQMQKNSLQLNISKRWSHAYIDDTEIAVQKRNVTYVELGWVHKHYFGDAQLDLTLAERCGTSWFGGQSDAPNRPQEFPTYVYTLQTVDATLNVPFLIEDQLFNYSTTLRGQTTHSPLYLADEFSIGGRYTVRGFDGELTLAAERGFYLRNEISTPISGSGHSVYAGIDVGKVFGPSVESLVGSKLAGAAIGLRGNFQKFLYDVFTSWPVSRPTQFATAVPAIGFSLTMQY